MQKATTSKSTGYTRWTVKNRFDIGKYASEHGNAAAVRNFRKEFPNIKESSVREFRKRYEQKIKEEKKKNLPSSKEISKYQTKTGRPLLLGKFDAMVQEYIQSMSNRGASITWSIANSAAGALIKKYPGVVGDIDLDSSSWAQSLFRRMGFTRRRKTTSKVDIPEAARKEIEYLFLYEIVNKVEKYKIPDSLVINLDQTPLKIVQCSNTTLAKKNSKNVTIVGSSDKRSITATFSITLSGKFLPMQLIYGGKTQQSLPRYQFPSGFSLSVNEKHFSNTTESIKLLKEIIIPYVKKEREAKGLGEDQKALVVMDVFTGQMTSEVRDVLRENNILVTNVPANMTRFYQPLDLTVNGSAKRFLAKKFNGWYSQQIAEKLDLGVSLEDIDVKLRLSTLKPLHAGWVVDFYNHVTSAEGKKIVLNGWKAAGIYDALKLGGSKLPSIDPFHDIDPLILENSVDTNVEAVCQLEEEEIEAFCPPNIVDEYDNDSEDEEWGPEGARNIFDDVLNEFDDEQSL